MEKICKQKLVNLQIVKSRKGNDSRIGIFIYRSRKGLKKKGDWGEREREIIHSRSNIKQREHSAENTGRL